MSLFPGFSPWMLSKSRIDPGEFGHTRVGSYLLGPQLRTTREGEVYLALRPDSEDVFEIEVFSELGKQKAKRPKRSTKQVSRVRIDGGEAMLSLQQAVGFEHESVLAIIGAGIVDDDVYVVRRHKMGRPLLDLLTRQAHLSIGLSTGVLYAVARCLAHLSSEEPYMGALSPSGFDARDVMITYDGEILFLAQGRATFRGGASNADVEDKDSLIKLAKLLDVSTSDPLAAVVEQAPSFDVLARTLRHKYRDACARHREFLGNALREAFAEMLCDERAFFGLAPIQ